MMLLHADQERALDYLSGCIDQVTSFGDILQLIIVELIYKVTNFLSLLQLFILFAYFSSETHATYSLTLKIIPGCIVLEF